MFAVIVGDMTLESEGDRQRVFALIDSLKQKYRDLTIVTSGCERGIGKFVRDRCVEERMCLVCGWKWYSKAQACAQCASKEATRSRDVGFVEMAIHVWATMPSARLAQVYCSKNACLVELGEEFHVFQAVGREYGYISDLVRRISEALHKPPITLY